MSLPPILVILQYRYYPFRMYFTGCKIPTLVTWPWPRPS